MSSTLYCYCTYTCRFYTYFAADGFSYGSTSRHWPHMCAFARAAGLVCTLSVGPGYQDDKIRPWNGQHTRPRRAGGYYDDMWRRALEAGAEVVIHIVCLCCCYASCLLHNYCYVLIFRYCEMCRSIC